MASYRILRLKDSQRQSFRWAAHTSGPAQVTPRDYERKGEVEAPSPYSAWRRLQGTEEALEIGDLLEDPSGALRIYKYVGFEEARWLLPEVKPGVESMPAAAGPMLVAAALT